MKRLLAPAPAAYNPGELAAQFPGCFGVNEVDDKGKTMLALYLPDSDATTAAQWAAAVAAHVPGPPPTLPDDDLDAALAAATTVGQVKTAFRAWLLARKHR